MALQARDERLYRHRAEPGPDAGTELGYRGFGTDGGAIGAVRGHSVECVGNSNQTGTQGNFFSLKIIRVTFTIVSFMMIKDNVFSISQKRDFFKNISPSDGMPAHYLPFFI